MIIILGMAGAGKSTQCRSLSDSGEFKWVAVGELIRSTVTGAERESMLHGVVLDDSVVQPLVQKEIDKVGDVPEILLDGCPRTLEQARWLASAETTPAVRAVLHLVIDEETTVQRLLQRGRVDDTEDAIRQRIAGYYRDIGPVLDAFKQKNIPVIDIDATKDKESVLINIKKALQK